MDKDRNMKNRIRGQVMYLNPPMVKKTSEKVRNRKSEALENMRVENDRFTHFLTRKGFTSRAPPMDYFLRLKEMILYKT
jgi:hypothetical protein